MIVWTVCLALGRGGVDHEAFTCISSHPFQPEVCNSTLIVCDLRVSERARQRFSTCGWRPLGCRSNISIMIPNSSKITVRKQQQDNFMVSGQDNVRNCMKGL